MTELTGHVHEGEVLPALSPVERFWWLTSLGLTPADLAGGIVAVAGHKGGIGKTMIALELAYLLGAVLVDLDWDRGNATRAWGYKEEKRKNAPLLDALASKRVPRPLSGGPWRADLVPCHSEFAVNQPDPTQLADTLEHWADVWAQQRQGPVVLDTHPGGAGASLSAVSAAHLVVVPVVLGEREMHATEGLVDELRAYPLLLVPNRVRVAPPARYVNWLATIAKDAGAPVAPPISRYDWLEGRARRMAVCAAQPPSARAQPLVDEIHAVGKVVVKHVRAAL